MHIYVCNEIRASKPAPELAGRRHLQQRLRYHDGHSCGNTWHVVVDHNGSEQQGRVAETPPSSEIADGGDGRLLPCIPLALRFSFKGFVV